MGNIRGSGLMVRVEASSSLKVKTENQSRGGKVAKEEKAGDRKENSMGEGMGVNVFEISFNVCTKSRLQNPDSLSP